MAASSSGKKAVSLPATASSGGENGCPPARLGSSTTLVATKPIRSRATRKTVERQYVAIDLHLHRSVIVRENEAGEKVGVTRIDNDALALAEALRQAGEHPEAAIGIVDALAQLSFLVQGALANHAATQDLSIIQTRLLGVLRDREPTMQELARLLALDKSRVTGLVDRAEKRGLVQRTPSTDDRREVRVSLSPSARRTVMCVVEGFQADIASAIEPLSSLDRTRLSTLATRIVNGYSGSRDTGD
jgi:DNA-binding MarR family transcriptional regulator